MSRFMKLILFMVSIYAVVFFVLYVLYDIKYPMLDGTSIIIYLIVFVLSIIALTFLYDKEISNYILIPLYFTIVIGLRTFYNIFVFIDDLPINSEPKYGFEYYINHTFFSETTFNTYKVQEAYVFIGMVVVVYLVTLGVYIKNQKGSKKDNYLSE